MKSILLIGGAGYIGVEASKYFIKKKFKVTCFDNLIYGQKKPYIRNKNYKFIKGNICKKNELRILKNNYYDAIILLAGLVGDPITKKYKTLSKKINEIDTFNLIKFLISAKNFKKFIFISTCSNYGYVKGVKKIKEDNVLKPLSNYAKSKVKVENFLMRKRKNFYPTILRFATAFGYSDRMRFDLTINQFVLEMMYKKYIDVYDYNTWRPYCHIKDFSRLMLKVINSESKKTNYKIFNAGDSKNNFSKKKIAKEIQKYLPGKVKFTNQSKDKRNYIVDFSKVKKKLNFNAKFSIEYGIKEIISNLKKQKSKFNIYKKLGNFKIVNQ